MITVYTDGSCRKNPGPGTWCAIFIRENTVYNVCYGGNPYRTTNNQMELKGVLCALERARESPGEQFEIYTDSTYVVLGMNNWISSWIEKDFHGVKNAELWKRLIKAKTSNATIHWVKGHSESQYNKMADEICQSVYDKIKETGGDEDVSVNSFKQLQINFNENT